VGFVVMRGNLDLPRPAGYKPAGLRSRRLLSGLQAFVGYQTMRQMGVIIGVVTILLAATVLAQDAYYCVPITSLEITEGELPAGPEHPSYKPVNRTRVPYVRLDGPGEAYVRYREAEGWPFWLDPRFVKENVDLAVRATAGKDLAGRLYLPNADWSGMVRLRFRLPASAAREEAKRDFLVARRQHYEYLLQRGIPGAAWFRHQVAETNAALAAGQGEAVGPPHRGPQLPSELEDTYAVFTGGRALSENLQLDRLVTPAMGGEATVDIGTLPGISVREMDWAPLIAGKQPQKDPLAALVPADQHALFFPSFDAYVGVLDEAKRYGTPVLRLLEPRSEDACTTERYERQLCMKTDALSRLLGPQVIGSMAFTGSDPFLRTGSDVAVLFEPKEAGVLKGLLQARLSAALQANPQAAALQGTVEEVPYAGVRSPDRSICSYLASVGDAVVAANSLEQLRRIVAVQKGQAPSLASLPEYVFMRDHYRRGEPEETAFFMLSDAALRRWCGARWRICASRRTRAAAFMSELQARYTDALTRGEVKPGPLPDKMPLPDSGELALDSGGVISSVYGTLEFLTPISEIPLVKVTQAEADSYRRWLEQYHHRWRRYYDPIAVRLSLSPKGVGADVTVLPLVEWSEYNRLVEVSRNVSLPSDGGDPHEGTVAHVVMAINTDSEAVRNVAGFTRSSFNLVEAEPLAWLGDCVALYADDTGFWEDLLAAADSGQFMERNYMRLPIAFYAEVKSGLKLTAFLTAIRAFVEQSSPGMTLWETFTYLDQPYVRITPSPLGRGPEDELQNLAVYYAASGESLMVTLDEGMLKRALERRVAAQKAAAAGQPVPRTGRPWLGASLCLQADRKLLSLVEKLGGGKYREAMQLRSWGNIPILNEWKHMFPDRDPVAVHEMVWKTRLVCPGGGRYVWDKQWETMSSTAYGHPGVPKEGPAWPTALLGVTAGNFGLSFEHDGLRARGMIEREAAPP